MFLSLAQQLFLGRFTFLGHDHYWFSNKISVGSLVGLQVIKNFSKLSRCIRYHADILDISCWQRWLRLRDSGSVKSGATTSPILPEHQLLAFLYIWHFSGANISLQNQPAWSEAPPLLGRRSVLQVLSRSSITRGRGRRKEPSRRCSAGWSWKKKSKMHKLNCRQVSKIRCKDLRSNMKQLSRKDPWNNLPTLFLIDWALRQVLIAFWFLQRWRHTMTKDHNYLQKDR